MLDFNERLENRSNRAIAYAVSYIHSDRPRRGLRIFVQRGPIAKIYLNGQIVFEDVRGSGATAVAVAANLNLKAGPNTLVFKAVNDRSPTWQGAVRFTDASGEPVSGLRQGTSQPKNGD